MAYNGYYSPYYQDMNQQPSNHEQNSYPEQQRGNAPSYYHRDQAHPTDVNWSTQQAYSSAGPSYSNSNIYSHPSTGRAEPRRDGLQNTSTNYPPTSHYQVDTSALGSLAYASALGRNNPSAEQVVATRHIPSRGELNASPAQGIGVTRVANATQRYDPNTARLVNHAQHSRPGYYSGHAYPTQYSQPPAHANMVAATSRAEAQRQSSNRSDSSSVPTSTQDYNTLQPNRVNLDRVGDERVDHQRSQIHQHPSRLAHESQRSTQLASQYSNNLPQRKNSYQFTNPESRVSTPPLGSSRPSSTLQQGQSVSTQITGAVNYHSSHNSNQAPNHDYISRDLSTNKKEMIFSRVSAECTRCRKMNITCSGDPGDGQGCENCRKLRLQCQLSRV